MKTICASVLLLASMALAADHVVLVGSSGLTFTPNEVTAASGDTISFQFIKGVTHIIQIQGRRNMLTSFRITQSHNQRSLIHANLMEASGLASSQLLQPPAALQPRPPPVGPAAAAVTVIKWRSERAAKSLSSKSPSTRQPPSGSTALRPAIVKWVWFSPSMLMLRYPKKQNEKTINLIDRAIKRWLRTSLPPPRSVPMLLPPLPLREVSNPRSIRRPHRAALAQAVLARVCPLLLR